MLREKRERQQQIDLVILEQMIPEDHLLRRIDAAVDFSFIHDLCAPLYCENNGRPAIEPEIRFRMLIVGCLYHRINLPMSEFFTVVYHFRTFLNAQAKEPLVLVFMADI